MLFNGALALGFRFLLVWENEKLDEKFGKVGRLERDGTRKGREGGRDFGWGRGGE